jgi:predicted Zn finger-like uncharacterized protein
MTSERRLLVGLADIKAVTFACKKCATRVTVGPDKVNADRFQVCPECGHVWIPKPQQGKSATRGEAPMYDLLALLSDAIALQARETIGCRVLFEIEEPRS